MSSQFNTVSYVDAVRAKKPTGNQWLWGTLLVITFWLIGGSVFTFLLLPDSVPDEATVEGLAGFFNNLDSWYALLILLIGFIPLFVGIMVAHVWVLKLPLKELFAIQRNWSWKRMWLGFNLWGGLLTLTIIPVFIFNPESISFVLNWETFLPFLLIGLILFPIQTTSEELLFRGWFTRLFAQSFKSRTILSIIGGILFMIPHLPNPEALLNPFGAVSAYILIGFTFTWVTIRDRGLELAVGGHLINNLLAGIIFPYEGGVLPSEGVWFLTAESFDFQTFGLIIVAFLFIWLTRHPDEEMITTTRSIPQPYSNYSFEDVLSLVEKYESGEISHEEYEKLKSRILAYPPHIPII